MSSASVELQDECFWMMHACAGIRMRARQARSIKMNAFTHLRVLAVYLHCNCTQTAHGHIGTRNIMADLQLRSAHQEELTCTCAATALKLHMDMHQLP
eukprot:14389887-Alexandrium_andersonii.AAC.1